MTTESINPIPMQHEAKQIDGEVGTKFMSGSCMIGVQLASLFKAASDTSASMLAYLKLGLTVSLGISPSHSL